MWCRTMSEENPSRRNVLQTLAAAGLAGGLVPGRVAGDNGVGASDISTQNVEMNDLEYQLDYDIDRFSGSNVSNSGGVRYEQKKYAADSSFFTWQSGTWVNSGDDSRDTNLAGNVYAPGANNSEVIVEISGSTETDLYFGQCYAYTDDENDSDFPSAAWSEYAFDVAWSIMDEATPFWVPPRPPSVEQDSNETSISDGPDGATIEYYDPTPGTAEEAYRATHSADWRWDASGAVEPGWNYVRADRQVDVGEWQWDDVAGWTFGQEQGHQLALSTAFCIYTEDETVCETDTCTSSPCPTSDAEITQDLQDCCQLDNIADPIPVTPEHLQTAKSRAQSEARAADRDPASQFEQQAVLGYEKGPKMDRPFRELVAYRSSAGHARGADASKGALNGVINAANAEQRVDQTVDEVSRFHDRLKYVGETLDETIGKLGQIEKRLVSARAWAESALEAFELDYMSDDEQVKFGESAMEFAHGNIEDAKFYREAGSVDATAPKQEQDLVALYDELVEAVRDGVENGTSGVSPHVEYGIRNARSYLGRAEERYADDFVAAAVLDLFYANAYLATADAAGQADFEEVDEATLEVEQELVADRFNQAAAEVSGDVERFLLKLARLEYNTGVESFGTFKAMNDESEAERAYRHYVATETIVDVATDVSEDFSLN